MDLEIIILSKPERERQIAYDITYMWNLLINDTKELIYRTNRLTDFESKLVTKVEAWWGRDKLGVVD